jgi:hypothetical protein
MPAGDGTGPLGMGPMTGGGRGYCAGYAAPGWSGPVSGRAFWGRGAYRRAGRSGGSGFGGGRGWRHWYYATGLPRWARWGVPQAGAPGAPPAGPSREQEIELLKDETQWLKDQLEAIGKRMDELNRV